MNARKLITSILIGAYVFFWTGGIVAHTFLGGPPEHVRWTAPFFLFLAGILVVRAADARLRFRLVSVGLIGTAAELVGVHTGFPFGGYHYTDAIFPLAAGVPLVMMCAWMVLAGFVHQVVAMLQLPRTLSVLLFAGLLTSIDLVIDPLAAGPLEYWIWDATGAYYGIPVTNFAGWFLVSLVIAVVMGSYCTHNSMHWFVGYSITTFFAILAVTHGMGIAAFIGAVLLTLAAYVYFKHRANIAFAAGSSKSMAP